MATIRAVRVAEKRHPRVAQKPSYERDFYAWSLAQAQALRERRPAELDWKNLADEIESLARSDRREGRSRVTVILMHLLKWQHQAGKRSTSWQITLASQRSELASLLAESPSLRRQVPEILTVAYKTARELAILEMGLSKWEKSIPAETCPFTSEQVLDEEFFPEPR